MISQYKKKPVIIEAVQWTGNKYKEIRDFTLGKCFKDRRVDIHECCDENNIFIPTLEGTISANLNDHIIKGIKEKFYPCKPYIFNQTYEEA